VSKALPGNRAQSLTEGRKVKVKRAAGTVLKTVLDRAARKAVERTLAQTGGNVAEAAAILGIVRPSLYRIMKRYGIVTQERC